MTNIPLSIVNALSALLPGDTLIAHCGKDGWAKLEVSRVNQHSRHKHCSQEMLYFFQQLPEDFWGSLTFEYDFLLDTWICRERTCPPIENKLMVTLPC